MVVGHHKITFWAQRRTIKGIEVTGRTAVVAPPTTTATAANTVQPMSWSRRRPHALITGAALTAATAASVAMAFGPWRHDVGRLSLMHGWLPVTVQAFSAAMLAVGLGGRSRRWLVLWLPVTVTAGLGMALWAHWYVRSVGVAGDPAPAALWIWIGLSGSAMALMVSGWRGEGWMRRGVSVMAVPLCLLAAALALNQWVGYFPTVRALWTQISAGPLPNQTDRATVTAMQLTGVKPRKGVVVPVNIGAQASGFKHRGELVYLPPAWFASNPPPPLPVVMMIGGEFNTPSDWVRAGDAVSAADGFAAAHGGDSPVLVFVDSGGAFNIDTECVNGPRGNAADHLTKDIVPFMISNFGVSAQRAQWGVAGFSAGGTCAVDLAVMHPELFSAFADLAGDLSPNSGTKAQTIDRLFGGSVKAWSRFDPSTVITRHGPYQGVSGVFTVVSGQDAAANTLCGLALTNGIECTVATVPGEHDWPFAGRAWAAALPWLAGELGTPGTLKPQLSPQRSGRSAAAPSNTR